MLLKVLNAIFQMNTLKSLASKEMQNKVLKSNKVLKLLHFQSLRF